MKINKNIKFGKSDILKNAIKDRDVKVRITTMVDVDVLKKLRAIAEENNKGYQTILNDILREALFSEKMELDSLSEIEKVKEAIIVIAKDMKIMNPKRNKIYSDIIKGNWNKIKKEA